MANKVIDIANNSVTEYDILSQTPKNYSKDNYFLKELQHKINIEWKYRPNRCDVEYEESWGTERYVPMEVVIQTVRTDKGVDLSDHCRRIVFRDISEERFTTGHKFRFSRDYNLNAPDIQKNIWLVTNYDTVSMTASVVIEKTNGTIGSAYKDDQGLVHYHYEPVIQGRELNYTNFHYDDPITVAQGRLIVTCQRNRYTENYFINQRFIIGYNDGIVDGDFKGKGYVYRVSAISKYFSDTTYDSSDVGLIRLYLEKTETSPYDDFNTRIAYQEAPEVHLSDENINIPFDEYKQGEYHIIFKEPEYIPTDLTSEKLTFKPVVVVGNEEKLDLVVKTSIELENLPSGIDPVNYVVFEEDGDNPGVFTLSRKRLYLGGDLIVTSKVDAADSPTGKDITTSFKMVVSRKNN